LGSLNRSPVVDSAADVPYTAACDLDNVGVMVAIDREPVPSASAEPSESEGHLAENIARFARVLRAAGLAIGPASLVDALRALPLLDLSVRDEVRACLRALFVHRQEDLPTFEQAFQLFFRAHDDLRAALSLLLPQSPFPQDRADTISRRVAEAMPPPATRLPPRKPPQPRPEDAIELDASQTASSLEVLRHRDFAEMSASELAEARRLLAQLRFALDGVRTRRMQPSKRAAHSRLDLRATLRASLRSGGSALPICFQTPRTRPPALVVLCDISGSMNRYTEMLMRFIHTLMRARRQVQCFLMGTRLSNATRWLRGRDIDLALARCGKQVRDWGGGTRLGACLREFNLHWSRRVLPQGAIVLLISDGLERDPEIDLAAETARLQRSCRRLVWLNPLLGYEGFAPRAQGILAMLPHVDEFRPVHNLDSMHQLAAALSQRANPPRPLRPTAAR
jgi:hypothetical protein